MASVGNGTAIWSLRPREFSASSSQYQSFDERSNYMMSVNSPIRYQVTYSKANLYENTLPVTGDVVNVIFTIYGTSDPDFSSSLSNWEEIAEIRKSRDVPNAQAAGLYGANYPLGH